MDYSVPGRQQRMGVPFRGGFNRSKQHNERCVSSESVANETETPDPLQRKPEGVDVGTLARRRVAAVVRNKSVTVATISVSLRDQRPTRSSIASSPADVEVPVDGEMPVSVGHQQPLKKARLNDRQLVASFSRSSNLTVSRAKTRSPVWVARSATVPILAAPNDRQPLLASDSRETES